MKIKLKITTNKFYKLKFRQNGSAKNRTNAENV